MCADASGVCEKCSDSCLGCVESASTCISCDNTSFLTNNKCESIEELMKRCKTPLETGGCAVCKDGFFFDEKNCIPCSPECAACVDGAGCTRCNEEHFMKPDQKCKAKNETAGCAGAISSDEGCLLCSEGFFLEERECSACSAAFSEWVLCTDKKCLRCSTGFVLASGSRIHLSSITHCVEERESRCTRCSFWNRLSESGDGCVSHAVWWVLLLAVLALLFLFALLVALV